MKKSKHMWNKRDLLKEVTEFFHRQQRTPVNYKQVSAALGLSSEAERMLVQHILRELERQEFLIETERGKYRTKTIDVMHSGKVEIIQSGSAYISGTGNTHDIFVHQRNLKGAMDGDEVKVRLMPFRKGRRSEGEIIEIVKRARTEFVGVLELNDKFAFVISENNRSQPDIFIPLKKLNGAANRDLVQVRITEWPEGERNPAGEIIKVFGKPGDHQTEIHAIMAEFDLPLEFEPAVLAEAEKIADRISEEEILRRKDFREVLTLTIDPVDAKDFDDALSIRQLENNQIEIGVHIADVAHYVKQGSVLDQEAFNRATSVYLVDRVVPMLPEKLSNMVCSLRPMEDKLCFSAVFVFDHDAELLHEWFGRTVICSNKRFTYEEAQQTLDTGEGPHASELKLLNNLALKLRAGRFKKGAIAFDKREVKFNLDPGGKPLGVYFKKVQDTNRLIEEFMLMANKRVALFCSGIKEVRESKTNAGGEKASGRPMVYRVHDQPDPDKLADFSGFISRFGYKINTGSHKSVSKSFNKLLQEIEGTRQENIIEQLAIRTMAKAEYSVENIGHYGLAFDYYTHFTSPIRRYPDVMVHRLLEQYLNEKEQGDKKTKSKISLSTLEEQCKHASEMERRAAEAERASVKFKQVEFLSDKIGQEFEGTISGVMEWGIFVELNENHCEGMIRIRDLTDDTYVFDEDNFCFFGRRSRKVIQLGDKVVVKIKKCDMARKQTDFSLIRKIESELA